MVTSLSDLKFGEGAFSETHSSASPMTSGDHPPPPDHQGSGVNSLLGITSNMEWLYARIDEYRVGALGNTFYGKEVEAVLRDQLSKAEAALKAEQDSVKSNTQETRLRLAEEHLSYRTNCLVTWCASRDRFHRFLDEKKDHVSTEVCTSPDRC